MNLPPIYRVVTNGRRYAVQRKASVLTNWEFCTYFVATSDFSGMWVPYEYPFKWLARWRMCKLMLTEFQTQKASEETWTEVKL